MAFPHTFNDVRERAALGAYTPVASVSFDELFKERNLELALEGDRWYDYVRVGYYNADYAVEDLLKQHRNAYQGSLNDVFKKYYEDKVWNVSEISYNSGEFTLTRAAILSKLSSLPFPAEDVVYNPNLEKPAQPYDLSTITF